MLVIMFNILLHLYFSGRASPSRKTNSMCLTLPHSEIDTLTNNCDVANSTSNTGVISYRHSSIDISDDVF